MRLRLLNNDCPFYCFYFLTTFITILFAMEDKTILLNPLDLKEQDTPEASFEPSNNALLTCQIMQEEMQEIIVQKQCPNSPDTFLLLDELMDNPDGFKSFLYDIIYCNLKFWGFIRDLGTYLKLLPKNVFILFTYI